MPCSNLQCAMLTVRLARCLIGRMLLVLTMSIAVAKAETPSAGTNTAPGTAVPAGEAGRQRNARLDALFRSLRQSRDEAEAREIVAEIWRAWTTSGRANVDALMQQAGAGMASRNYGLASMLLDEVVEIAPEYAEGWNRRATLRFMMSDHATSLADIDKALALEPRHFGALAGRAMIHMAAERWKMALEAYRAALAINPFLAERQQVIPELERRVEGRPL